MDPNQNPNYYNPNTPPNRNPNTPPPNWVFTPSPMNPFFDSNCYRPNFDSSPQGFYTFADYGSSPQPHGFAQLSQDEVVPETQPVTNAGPSTQPKEKRRHRRKQAADTEPAVGGSSRIEKWTTEEEFQLTKAWIDVSEDPIVGRNQKGPDFWSKIRNQFFQAMGRGEYRTNDMLSSKWRDMNLKVRKFNGIYSQKWQTRRSGQSDAMIEREAEEQYREEFNTQFSLQRRTAQTSIELLERVDVFDLNGNSVLISDLWKDRKAVVAFARHFGCVLCRKRADMLAAKKDRMDASGVALVLIGPGSVDQHNDEYFLFVAEVYADPSYASYKALNFVSGVTTTFTPGAALKIIEAYMEGYRQDWELSFEKDTRTRGGWQQGGIIVAGPGISNISYIHKDKEAGDDPDVEEILQACCS
ncbi:hypothetical protein E3N88_44893 [Mikania micrantha]|uniref:Myb-like domain-containing protein n=1 Tax=Mikania micrantha TaxID=192012 RepID=A0A5N6LAY9_9ASTR|nr:hypothetical protein E3N88_44893 [Mikania micrantha]